MSFLRKRGRLLCATQLHCGQLRGAVLKCVEKFSNAVHPPNLKGPARHINMSVRLRYTIRIEREENILCR